MDRKEGISTTKSPGMLVASVDVMGPQQIDSPRFASSFPTPIVLCTNARTSRIKTAPFADVFSLTMRGGGFGAPRVIEGVDRPNAIPLFSSSYSLIPFGVYPYLDQKYQSLRQKSCSPVYYNCILAALFHREGYQQGHQ